jgi:hypothetical protein
MSHVHVHLHRTTDAFEESKHPRADNGRFGEGGSVVKNLKKSVPQLKHFKYTPPSEARPHHHHFSASTEAATVGKSSVPVTVPGHPKATGIAIKANQNTKHIHFSEVNSHIKGAGQKMVEEIIKSHPGYDFSVTDWSSEEGRGGPSFWDKIKKKYPGRFAEDD